VDPNEMDVVPIDAIPEMFELESRTKALLGDADPGVIPSKYANAVLILPPPDIVIFPVMLIFPTVRDDNEPIEVIFG
jgi:hypothetical protein